MQEKKLDFSLEYERPWERRPAFLELNPAGQLPILQDLDGTIIVESLSIGEYLEECYPEIPLLGTSCQERAEVRRLVNWFEIKFYQEVTTNLVFQKLFKRHFHLGDPDAQLIRYGYSRLQDHLEYIEWLTDRRRWLAGESFSLADIAAAAQLSCLDYLGDIPWSRYVPAKDWYVRVKSRPAFRVFLQEKFPGFSPAPHYHDLDF